MNGSGSVVTVNMKSPDASGNVTLTGDDIPVSADDETTIPDAIEAKQAATKDLAAEATLADGDYFPFYDVSVSLNRKTPWSNIVSKIRAAFKTTALPVDSGGTGATTADAARANLGALSNANGAVGTANLGSNVVTAEKLANDIPYTKFGLSADQVRHVYAGTTEPGAELGSDGDIYLMYSE